jgi:uracil-DNA glycosylase family 4
MVEMMFAKKQHMARSVKGKTLPDPRSKAGPFDLLFREIQACKANKTCPSLKTRQFYFEPNNRSTPFLKEWGFYSEHIDYRLMFICESPGPSAEEGNAEDLEPCFYGSPRDRRFLDVRQKYDLANCYITNTVKCGVRRGAKHDPDEVDACRKFLVHEINLIKPPVIVCVGGNAFRTTRTEVLAHLGVAPILFQITHYSSRRNPWDAWDREFPELLRLLARLRPRQEWPQ